MPDFKSDLPITRFFACIFFIVAGLTILIAGFVFVVDPYAIWRHRDTRGVNAIRLDPPSANQPGAAVLRSALRSPEVLILGSSRVRRGFNETLASRLHGSKVQVVGIDALPLSKSTALYLAISKDSPVKKLYLEVSYLTSSGCEVKNATEADDNGYAGSFYFLSPRDAFMHSLRTVKANLLPLRPFDSYFDSEGYYYDDPSAGASRAGEIESHASRYSRFFQATAKACRRNASTATDIRNLAEILRLARRTHTEVFLLVLPASARWQERIRQAGLAQKAARWKMDVAALALRSDATLLDYEQRGDAESPGDAGDLHMPVYWDEVHFSNRLGDRLLSDMLHASPARGTPGSR